MQIAHQSSNFEIVLTFPHKTLTLVLFCLLLIPHVVLALSFDDAKHLLSRTTLGYSAEEIQRFMQYSKKEAVQILIQEALDPATPAPPKKMKELSKVAFQKLSREEKQKLNKQRKAKNRELVAWWLEMILKGQSPLREKMVLFWHNHFTSSYRKVKHPYYMYLQNQLLRKYALGSFGELVHKITQDPAMLIYLDGRANKKSAPNENFARELLELFTLGEGHYTQQDIKESARAFAGYGIHRQTLKVIKYKKRQDRGQKVFMGEQGRFGSKEIVNIILKQERTAIFVTEKLYQEFIAFQPNSKEVSRLAKIFRESDYNIKILLNALLMSPDFWKHRANLIKSPVEFAGFAIQAMKQRVKTPQLIAKFTERMGQSLLNPPHVKGYDGGKAYITSHTLLNRKLFIQRMTRGQGAFRNLQKSKITTKEFQNLYLLLPNTLSAKGFQAHIREILLDPTFHLK